MSSRNNRIRIGWYGSGSGGEAPADQATDILIFKMGQSNEAGGCGVNRLEPLTSYTERPIGVKRFVKAGGYFSTSDDGGWIDYFSGKTHNQAVSLGKLIHDRMNRNVYMLEAALSGTALASIAGTFNDWNELNTSDCYQQATLHHFTAAIAKLPSDREFKVVICWHQGEADGTVPAQYNAYATNFPSMMTALRAYHPKLADAPLLITKLHYNVNGGEAVINSFFATYCANPANNAYLIDVAPEVTYPRNVDLTAEEKAAYPPVGYSDDNHNSHYYQVKKGEMMYDQLLSINYIPSLVAPSGYDRDLIDTLLAAEAAGAAPPTTNNQDALHTLITALKTVVTGNKTVYQKMLALYPFANDGSGAFGLFNLKSTTLFKASLIDAPTWTTKQGYKGDGTNDAILTGLSPGVTIANFNTTWYNNLSIGQYVHAIQSKISFGIAAVGSNNDFYMHGTPAGSSIRCWNTTAVAPVSGLSVNTKYMALDRGLSTEYDYYVDAVKTNVAVARVGNSSNVARFLHDNGAFGDETIAVGFIGEHFTEAEHTVIRNAFAAYKAAL